MHKLIAIIAPLTAILSVGCVQHDTNVKGKAVSSALPTGEDVAIHLPEDHDSAGTRTHALTDGETRTADYYILTRNITRELNAGAASVLLLVHVIVQFPPTSVDGNEYTWGPHSEPLDPAEWMLVVTENADGTYDWRFDGRSKTAADATFLTIMDGHATPGSRPHRGSGTVRIDFDVAEQVNPIDNDAEGQVEIAYDLENRDGSAAFLDMQIRGEELDDAGNPVPVSATYHYEEQLDGAGNFQFDIHADIDEDGSAAEDAVIRSRWMNDGQGRADVRVRGGDLGELTVSLSECWDGTFARVYYRDSADWLPSEGDEAACVFADQDLPDV